MRKYNSLFLTAFSLSGLLSVSCGQRQEPRNPPEIVTLDSDTVFNRIPGKHHLGEQSFEYGLVEMLESVRKKDQFVKGLRATGLIDTLQSDGLFTVFAPSDSAFPWYESDTSSNSASSSDRSESDFTAEMIKAHIIPGSILKEDIGEGKTVKNLNGTTLTLKVENDNIIVNGKYQVTTSDINSSNGVIHEVEELFHPPGK